MGRALLVMFGAMLVGAGCFEVTSVDPQLDGVDGGPDEEQFPCQDLEEPIVNAGDAELRRRVCGDSPHRYLIAPDGEFVLLRIAPDTQAIRTGVQIPDARVLGRTPPARPNTYQLYLSFDGGPIPVELTLPDGTEYGLDVVSCRVSGTDLLCP